jgi:protein SCO1
MKNKSYIGISLVILVFGIWAVPKIVEKLKGQQVVQGERLDQVSGNKARTAKLEKIGKAPAFELINQDEKKVSSAMYAGKVYVLEFFFSTCPTICPVMNQNMLLIQDAFFGNPNFALASITINPEYDTPAVLKKHADDLGVKSSNWHFLTGEKQYIFDISNKGFNLYAGQNEKAAGGFEHSGLFALIDKDGIIRCRKDEFGNPIMYYDGTDPKGVEAIIYDIKLLLNE